MSQIFFQTSTNFFGKKKLRGKKFRLNRRDLQNEVLGKKVGLEEDYHFEILYEVKIKQEHTYYKRLWKVNLTSIGPFGSNEVKNLK